MMKYQSQTQVSKPQQQVINFKIIVIGSSGVGKSNIISRFTQNKFGEKPATVGIDFASKNIVVENNRIVLKIWDTAGQEKYRALSKIYYKDSQVIIMVYDIINRNSFEQIEKVWFKQTQQIMENTYVTYVLVGNKCDLVNNRIVSYEEGKALAAKIGCQFFEVSAANKTNIDELFDYVSKDTFKRKNDSFLERPQSTKIDQHVPQKRKCC